LFIYILSRTANPCYKPHVCHGGVEGQYANVRLIGVGDYSRPHHYENFCDRTRAFCAILRYIDYDSEN